MGKKKRNKSGQAGGSVAVATEIKQVPGSRTQGFSASSESKPAFYSSRYFEWLALALASLVSYWILTSRLVGVNVSVLIDEYSYVLDAHYKGMAEAAYPNHLFQLIYSTTLSCGPAFYECARAINTGFVIAGSLVLYVLANEISGKKWIGAFVGVAAAFGSFGTYSAYFMPEAIFNFLMVLFFYGLTRFYNSDVLWIWASLGAVLALAALAKPHAFFVVPAIVIFVFLSTRAQSKPFLGAFTKRAGVFLGFLFGIKLGLGYLLAGDKGLSIFGSYGGGQIDSDIISSSAQLVETTILADSTLNNVLTTSWGQTVMMVMILGVIIPVAAVGLGDALKRDPEQFASNKFRALFTLALLNMMAVVALFEAWQNLTTWMHTRYNSYLIPLGLIVLAEAYSKAREGSKNQKSRFVIVTLFGLLSIYALVTAGVPYGANWVDAPDFRAHIDNPALSSLAIVIALLIAVWWLWDKRTSMLVGLGLAVLLAVGSGSYISSFMQENFGKDTVSDQLGRVLLNYLPQEELDRAVVAGSNHTAIERALFGAMSGGAKIHVVPESGSDASGIGEGASWLITLGEPKIAGLGDPDISGVGFSLYSLSEENVKEPRESNVAGISSLCQDPDFALWACGAETVITLSRGFGQDPTVDLVFEISDSRELTEIEVVAGGVSLQGEFEPGVYALSLNFPSASQNDKLLIRNLGVDPNADDLTERFVRVISANPTS